MLTPLLIAAVIAADTPPEPLATRVATALAGDSASWVAWDVPAIGDEMACCWSSSKNRSKSLVRLTSDAGSTTCSLGRDNVSMWNSRDNNKTLAPQSPNTITVYVRGQGREVDLVRAYSAQCSVATEGEAVHRIESVNPGQSVAFLSWLAKRAEAARASRRRSDGALTAIALHADDSATPALEALASGSPSRESRKNAAFRLGNTRGQPGYQALVRLRASSDVDFREQLTFAFSQSPVPEASSSLVDMARTDPSPRVRGQALFWVAQKAQKKTDADVIRTAAVDDPDEDVKKKAVFALSQIPGGEGVPDLIRVARENKSHEVRKQAMFWLGQSKDPRALAFFETILSR